MIIIPSFIQEEDFRESYQNLSDEFKKLGEQAMEDLLDRVNHAEKNIIPVESSQRTNEQWEYLGQISKDLKAEAKRYNEIEKQKNIAKVNQELSDLEKRVLSQNIPENEREEISSYFQLKREQGRQSRDESFINAMSNVESEYLLPFIKITQAHLKGKRKASWEYDDKLKETLPELFKSLPPEYKNKVIDILVTSAENERSAVGVYILSEQIPKQLGLVEYDESEPAEPKEVKEEHRDFYLETAKRLVEADVHFDNEILGKFPEIVERQGVEETKRIIDVAMKIKDEDFPGEPNVVVFYTGIKAGHTFSGDQEKLNALVKQVEERYK